MSKDNVLLAMHNLSELKSLANNAKIRSSLKILLNYYLTIVYYSSKLWYYESFISYNPPPPHTHTHNNGAMSNTMELLITVGECLSARQSCR